MATVKLGDMAVGSTVKLQYGSGVRYFIIVHKGLPGPTYDTSCDGVWLLMQNILTEKKWNTTSNNDYAGSDVHKYLNDDLLGLFGYNIRTKFKQVKLPYCPRNSNTPEVVSGGDGLPAQIFLLSAAEVGFSGENYPIAGAVLDYFNGCENSKRIATLNGDQKKWSLRSKCYTPASGEKHIAAVTTKGASIIELSTRLLGVRPALVLPYTLSVNDDGEVLANEPPTTPSGLTLPDKIQGGGKTTITWGASTDPDGNLEGYILERSLDGGSSWTQVYQGGGLSTTNTVPFGSDTVMYRVRAYDSEGAYSAYRTSAQVAVDNNTAPNTPGAINVPAAVNGGGTLVVTWSASYDAEGNLAGYVLERRVGADGPWTEVYRGTALSYQDAITKGWASVAYRVKAYDTYGAESGWAVSPTRTVDNNTAPTVASDSAADLGTQNEGFTVPYTVDDADGDVVTVQEALDGAMKRQFTAVLGQPNTFDVTGEYFQRVLNGAHRLEVTATDAGGKSSALAVSFSKAVTACSITLERPMEADAPITVCVLSVTGSIPADAEYTLEVTNNALDDAPVWEDCIVAARNGANHVFANQTAANGFAFNFRLRAARGPGGVGGYITSVQGGFQ